MKAPKIIDWQYVIGLLLLPFAILVSFLGIAKVEEWTRYDPAYFTPEYIARYEKIGALLSDLEHALQTGDAYRIQELQGTRLPPRNVEARRNVGFSIFWQQDGKYQDYLYFDIFTYERYMKHLRQVNGRFVLVPEGLYYYMDSGVWITFFGPLAVIWWIVLGLFTIGMWIYRQMAKFRREMHR